MSLKETWCLSGFLPRISCLEFKYCNLLWKTLQLKTTKLKKWAKTTTDIYCFSLKIVEKCIHNKFTPHRHIFSAHWKPSLLILLNKIIQIILIIQINPIKCEKCYSGLQEERKAWLCNCEASVNTFTVCNCRGSSNFISVFQQILHVLATPSLLLCFLTSENSV